MRTVAFVVGTRAQLIKVAPVVVACTREALDVRLVMTGQHAETMDDLLAEFDVRVPPEYAIPAGEHATVRSLLRWLPRATRGLRRTLRALKRTGQELDVVVHGDTLSAVLGAWVGRRIGARVLHLESGLSSGRWYDPFPEELARRLVFRLADVAFCPTDREVSYMRQHYRCDVVDTGGNTIVDAVALTGAVRPPAPRKPQLLVSLHRFQNLYDKSRFSELMQLVVELSRVQPVTFVLHPATSKRLQAGGLLSKLQAEPGLTLSPRLRYGEFLRLAASASCVLTDGGSNQEELAALGVPTIVMRPRTERSDGLGGNALLEADVPGGVLEFVRQGGAATLERPATSRVLPGPSERIARYLAGGCPA